MAKQNLFDEILQILGEQQALTLFEDLKNNASFQPQMTVSKGLAFAFATLIHSLTFFIAVAGILLIFRGFSSIFLIFAGLVLLGVAWVLRPRRNKMKGSFIPATELAELNNLMAKICNALNAPNPAGFQINSAFNAGYKQQGIPSKHFVLVGLPLWSVLTGQEKVALLAHEMAHSINGDSTRGFFIGSAIHSLSEYHYMLHPDQIWDSSAGLTGILAIPFNLIMFLAAKLAYGAEFLLSFLLYRDMQRAEYFADILAATVAGQSAMISLLQKLHLQQKIQGLVRRYSLNDLEADNLFLEMKKMRDLPPEEIMDYANDQEPVRLDSTHPPINFRIKVLKHHDFSAPKFEIDRDSETLITQELEQFELRMAHKMIAAYEQSLYYR